MKYYVHFWFVAPLLEEGVMIDFPILIPFLFVLSLFVEMFL